MPNEASAQKMNEDIQFILLKLNQANLEGCYSLEESAKIMSAMISLSSQINELFTQSKETKNKTTFNQISSSALAP
jgi:hypothetical protein